MGVLVGVVAVTHLAGSGHVAGASSATPSASVAGNARPGGAAPAAASRPSAKAPPHAAESVTYACGGSAPHGIDIVYGPSGSSISADTLPFVAHGSIAEGDQYFAISARLRAGGDVTCTVSVVNGDRKTTRATATAEGGHNVAGPEVCSDFAGEWEACG